jgi:S1-C subfamily serine protease
MSKRFVLAAFLTVLVLTLLACQVSSLLPTPTSVPVPSLPASTVLVDLNGEQDRLITIFENTNPGVVAIKTLTSLASGWVYSSDGYIVTNAHAVGSETRLEVDFPSGQKVFGQVVGSDVNSDLAVIRVEVDASLLHPLPLGDSDNLRVGQILVAIGNPFGYDSTMTTGIVSALGRSLPTSAQAPNGGYYSTGDLIQTDAALNPGNSGGPLLDLNGDVVGVNRAIQTSAYTSSGDPVNSGIGFAISVNTVKRVVPGLIAHGHYDYPYLGIEALALDDIPLEAINLLGLPTTTGAYVTSIVPDGPCDHAGLRAGTEALNLPGYQNSSLKVGSDLIVAVDGEPVNTFDDLIGYLAVHKSPGDTITLTVWRSGQQIAIPVTLGTRP